MPTEQSVTLPKDPSIQDIVNVSHGYTDALLRLTQVRKESDQLSNYIVGDVDQIEARLKKFAVMEELTKHLNADKANVDKFFINKDGSYMKIVTENGRVSAEKTTKDAYDLKRSILIYMKQAAIFKADMEMEMDHFDEERKKIEESMGTTANEIVLQRLRLAMEKKKEIESADEVFPKNIVKKNQHIMSGFDFNVEIKTIRDRPSIVKNTLLEFRKEDMIRSYGERYRSAIKKSKSFATLISFIANAPDSSFEELYLPPDKYKKGYENLFLFSIIRFFSIEYWTEDTKIMHAMTIAMLQQMVDNELPRDIKDEFVDNISDYLQIFYNEL